MSDSYRFYNFWSHDLILQVYKNWKTAASKNKQVFKPKIISSIQRYKSFNKFINRNSGFLPPLLIMNMQNVYINLLLLIL